MRACACPRSSAKLRRNSGRASSYPRIPCALRADDSSSGRIARGLLHRCVGRGPPPAGRRSLSDHDGSDPSVRACCRGSGSRPQGHGCRLQPAPHRPRRREGRPDPGAKGVARDHSRRSVPRRGGESGRRGDVHHAGAAARALGARRGSTPRRRATARRFRQADQLEGALGESAPAASSRCPCRSHRERPRARRGLPALRACPCDLGVG
jgi:hypothetical protein